MLYVIRRFGPVTFTLLMSGRQLVALTLSGFACALQVKLNLGLEYDKVMKRATPFYFLVFLALFVQEAKSFDA